MKYLRAFSRLSENSVTATVTATKGAGFLARVKFASLLLMFPMLCLSEQESLSEVQVGDTPFIAKSAAGNAAHSTYADASAPLERLPARNTEAYSGADLFRTLSDAWDEASMRNKVVMLVLGSESCDRCALLDRYMSHESLSKRIEQHFIRVDLSVSRYRKDMPIAIKDEHLPAIILVESEGHFDGNLPADRLLTFRPEPYEPMYDWMENLLFYSDQVFAEYDAARQGISGSR